VKLGFFNLRSEIEAHLVGSQFKHRDFGLRISNDSRGTKQNGGISQQTHNPSQPQTIEKDLIQAELIFLIGLSGFNSWANLLKQPLAGERVHRQKSEQGFMIGGRKAELFLYPEEDAGKSVASINATDLKPSLLRRIKDSNKCSLMLRNPLTPIRSRKLVEHPHVGNSMSMG
jgi:hypothetical protein